MPTPSRKKFVQIALALNGFVFLAGGLLDYSSGHVMLGVGQFIIALLNLILLLRKLATNSQNLVNGLIFLLNVAVAIAISIKCIQEGKQYIQYAWMLAAFVSLVAFIRFFKHVNKLNKTSSN